MQLELPLNRPELILDCALVGGERKQASSGKRFEVLNPATLAALVSVPDCGAKEAEAAEIAAAAAFPGWRARTAKERSAILERWFALMKENHEDLARIISLEEGKPLAESRGEVTYAASFVQWFAEEAKRAYGEVIPEPVAGRKLIVLKEPVGVVAAITPWNFPIAMLARKVAPALAAGCTVVVKPAEDTPLSALAFAELGAQAGLSPGTVNIVTASREHASEVAGVWLRSPRVRKLSFTGSTAVGKQLMAQCAPTVKKVSLELGGNAPFIVFGDADLDAAVRGAIASKFRNSGQTCVCANRIFVQDSVYDAFSTKLAEAAARLRVGPAWQERSEQGPLINARGLAKVEDHVRDAVAQGGRVLTGGARHKLGGNFYQPTVITGATLSMKFGCEETFGPVAPLFRFRDEREVIALANDTPHGLASYFYTRDVGRCWRVAAALESGLVGVNEGMISTEVAPFGGIKESGLGSEGARQGLNEYFNLKYVCMGGLTAAG